MKDHSECKRQFVQLSRAWYAEANLKNANIIDDITIGFYHPDGGTTGEFNIRWMLVNFESVARLESFEDSWSALWGFSDVLQKLSELDGTNPTPEAICRLLENMGIVNATPTVSPYS